MLAVEAAQFLAQRTARSALRGAARGPHMRGDNDFLGVIESAQAAALDERLWPGTLKRLARLFGAVGATLEDFGKQPFGLQYLRTAGLPPEAETGYLDHYQRHNPRADYAFRHLSETILCDYVLIDERAMDHDAYYAKYLKALDLRYFMSGQIADTPGNQAIVSIQRTRRQGHVERADIERMRRLLPHVRLAYDMATRLRLAEGTASSLEQTLEWLCDGVALVRADGTIAYSNPAFQEIVRRNEGIRVQRGRIELMANEARVSLEQAVCDSARLRAGDIDVTAPADFPVARGSVAPPYLISIRPLAKSPATRSGAVAIVFVRDPAADDMATAQLLRDVFRLTDAETALARALLSGVSPSQYAHVQSVSFNTVYTHLRRIKEKTGCRRTPELIRKLNDLQVSVRLR